MFEAVGLAQLVKYLLKLQEALDSITSHWCLPSYQEIKSSRSSTIHSKFEASLSLDYRKP